MPTGVQYIGVPDDQLERKQPDRVRLGRSKAYER
jgi:hypothetical protein